MEKYRRIIEKISRVYGEHGYTRLWGEVLPDLEKQEGVECSAIVKEVVDGFLTKMNSCASSRVWGNFMEEDVCSLVKKCEEAEGEAVYNSKRLSEDDAYGINAISTLPRRGSSMFDC